MLKALQPRLAFGVLSREAIAFSMVGTEPR